MKLIFLDLAMIQIAKLHLEVRHWFTKQTYSSGLIVDIKI